LPTFANTKKPFDVICCLHKMKPSYWLQWVVICPEWSRLTCLTNTSCESSRAKTHIAVLLINWYASSAVLARSTHTWRLRNKLIFSNWYLVMKSKLGLIDTSRYDEEDEEYESFSARCELTLIDDEKHNDTILVGNDIICRQITSFDLPFRRHPGS